MVNVIVIQTATYTVTVVKMFSVLLVRKPHLMHISEIVVIDIN